MKRPSRRVMGASIIGCSLIVAAYIVNTTPATVVSEEPALVVAAAPSRVALPERDQDGDGIPDWKEALISNETPVLESHSTSTYEVPDTLTGQFSIQLFEDMVNAKGFDVYGDTPEELIDRSINELQDEIVFEPYTEDDLTVVSDSNDPDFLRTYFNATALAIATGNSERVGNELGVLQESVTTQDPTLLEPLAAKRLAYEQAVTNLKQVSVPKSYVDIHLDLINIMSALAISIAAMEDVYDDPLRTLLYVQAHPDNADGLLTALRQYTAAVAEVDFIFETSDAGQVFLYFTQRITE